MPYSGEEPITSFFPRVTGPRKVSRRDASGGRRRVASKGKEIQMDDTSRSRRPSTSTRPPDKLTAQQYSSSSTETSLDPVASTSRSLGSTESVRNSRKRCLSHTSNVTPCVPLRPHSQPPGKRMKAHCEPKESMTPHRHRPTNTGPILSIPCVPSSQSQNLGAAHPRPLDNPPGGVPTGIPCPLMIMSEIDDGHRTSFPCENEESISSSQSQHLSPSPSNCIPSSQSQEAELTIVGHTRTHHPSYLVTRHPTGNTQRTCSDKPFLVPIHATSFDELFFQGADDEPTTQTVDPLSAENCQKTVTDSELEDESILPLHRAEDIRILKGSRLYPHSAPEFSSTNPDPWEPSSEESHHNLGISMASLPSPVKHFKCMFADADESYPPDFPMSLQ